jgi:hypothetical protein
METTADKKAPQEEQQEQEQQQTTSLLWRQKQDGKKWGTYLWLDHSLTLPCGCWLIWKPGKAFEVDDSKACEFHSIQEGWEMIKKK